MEQRAYITLSQLQSRISIVVEDAFDRPIWVVAEIAELKLNRSGHCYLELVEKGEREAICASARGVIWRTGYQSLMRRFEAESGRTLAAGMKILAKIAVSYHPLYGLSLQIIDLDPTYTLGDIEQRKRETIERLQREGVWDMNRTLPLPRVVQRIAIVSSATAAGYRDFMQEIASSPYNITTTLFEAAMQGESSEQSVVDALMAIAERESEFDAVAIIRGGGSVADLECFNSYLTAVCVAQYPLPVLTGIGHDKDVSVVDMVAAMPLKTPTAVATWICDRAAAFDGQLEYYAILLRESCTKATQGAELRLSQQLDLINRAAQTALTRQRDKIAAYAMLIENFSPQRLLKLGFAVARGESGAVIRSVNDCAVGSKITVTVTDGDLVAEVIERYGKKE